MGAGCVFMCGGRGPREHVMRAFSRTLRDLVKNETENDPLTNFGEMCPKGGETMVGGWAEPVRHWLPT